MFIIKLQVRTPNSAAPDAVGPETDPVGQKEAFIWLTTKKSRSSRENSSFLKTPISHPVFTSVPSTRAQT